MAEPLENEMEFVDTQAMQEPNKFMKAIKRHQNASFKSESGNEDKIAFHAPSYLLKFSNVSEVDVSVSLI
jgi:hypothetical protein